MREATPKRHEVREREVESKQIRKIDVVDADMLREVVARLVTGLFAGDLDGEHGYAASVLRQHVAGRRGMVERERSRAQSRFAGAFWLLARDLTVALERASRLEDGVANAVVGGGMLDVVDAAALRRLLDEIMRLLHRSRQRELELGMRQHWVDLGEGG